MQKSGRLEIKDDVNLIFYTSVFIQRHGYQSKNDFDKKKENNQKSQSKTKNQESKQSLQD